MRIDRTDSDIGALQPSVLGLCTFEDGESKEFARVAGIASGRIGYDTVFSGKALTVRSQPDARFGHVVIVGLGKREDLTPELLRRAGGIMAKAARDIATHLTVLPLAGMAGSAELLLEGAILGNYRFLRYKTVGLDEIRSLDRITVLTKRDLTRTITLATNVNYARDLVNTPASDMTPATLAAEAKRLAKRHRLRCTVFDVPELRRRKMHAMLAVGQGSVIPPRMITLEYRHPKAKRHLIFCGKGVCYDSGGYNIKLKMQEWMKDDMGGAAALLGMIASVAELKLPVHITVIIGAVENLVSGTAYKPGDVVRAMNGKTIEVVNTDAEGRIVLADCLSYASTITHDWLIDVATLTGAAMVALGTLAAAVCSPNERLVNLFREAGERTGDRVWEIPLWEDYAEDVKSDIADVKNLGHSFFAGVTAGAMLLKEFVADPSRWLHIDMGAAVMEERERAYVPKGATGWGVRLLTEVVEKSG